MFLCRAEKCRLFVPKCKPTSVLFYQGRGCYRSFLLCRGSEKEIIETIVVEGVEREEYCAVGEKL